MVLSVGKVCDNRIKMRFFPPHFLKCVLILRFYSRFLGIEGRVEGMRVRSTPNKFSQTLGMYFHQQFELMAEAHARGLLGFFEMRLKQRNRKAIPLSDYLETFGFSLF